MRKFLIITLVLLAVLVMATTASASVRDSVASLVGDRTDAAHSNSGEGTCTVTAAKTDVEAAASGAGAAWSLENGDATVDGDGTYVFRSSEEAVDPAVEDPAGDEDRHGEEMEPVGPGEEPPAEAPVDAQTASQRTKGQNKDIEEPVAE